MEPERPLPQPQEPATCSSPEPDQSSPLYVSNINFNIILPSMPRCSEWYLSIRSPHHNSICTPYSWHVQAQTILLLLIWSPKEYDVDYT